MSVHRGFADPQEEILFWLAEYDGEPIPGTWVPGANEPERRQLAALGGLIREIASVEAHQAASIAESWGDSTELKQWLTTGPEVPPRLVEQGRRLLAESSEDGLASLYAQIVSIKSRRRLGTFFTPRAEVERMVAAWGEVGRRDLRTIVDVGAGVGIFTLSVQDTWPDAQIFSVDVNPVTLGLLALRVATKGAIVGQQAPGPGVRLVLDDYVSWAQKTWDQLPSPRLIIGNPPYTRMQLLPIDDRERLLVAGGGLCGSRASLSALITAASLRLLGPDDGLCLLLPAQWLESDYARALREWLWKARSRRLELHLFESEMFRDAQVDAVSLLVGPESSADQVIVATRNNHEPRTFDRTNPVPGEWRSLFRPQAIIRKHRSLPQLKDFARVSRGIATGANEFFVMTHETIDRHRIPLTSLVPLVRRLRDYPDRLSVSDYALNRLDVRDQRFLFTGFDPAGAPSKAVFDYIQYGCVQGYHERHLCMKRKNWFDLGPELRVPDVLVGPAAPTDFRFLTNNAGAVIVNNLYGLSWHEGTTKAMRAKILAWLRGPAGQGSLASAARTQGGGLLKIEPKALNDLILEV